MFAYAAMLRKYFHLFPENSDFDNPNEMGHAAMLRLNHAAMLQIIHAAMLQITHAAIESCCDAAIESCFHD